MWRGKEKPIKAQTRFIFNTHLKGTYKSQKLGKGKGFGSAGNLILRGAQVEKVNWVWGQGLKQEEIVESRDPICTILITHSRLGELFFVRVNFVICIWFCVMDFTIDLCLAWNSCIMCSDWEVDWFEVVCITMWYIIWLEWGFWVLLFLGHGQYAGSEDSNVLHCIYRAWLMIQVVWTCLVAIWDWFGYILSICVRVQRQNPASLAQASPSRLSENCKATLLI